MIVLHKSANLINRHQIDETIRLLRSFHFSIFLKQVIIVLTNCIQLKRRGHERPNGI